MIEVSLKIEIGVALKKYNNYRVYNATEYLISEDIVVQRDVIVLCNNPTHKFINFTLSVITEILSSSTALRDRNLKFWLYQNEGIKYYLIADADAKKIKIYQLVYKIYKPVNENAAEHVEFLFDEDCRPNVNLSDGRCLEGIIINDYKKKVFPGHPCLCTCPLLFLQLLVAEN